MKKRFSEQKITGFLKQAEAGVPVNELCDNGSRSGRTAAGGNPLPVASKFRAPDTRPHADRYAENRTRNSLGDSPVSCLNLFLKAPASS